MPKSMSETWQFGHCLECELLLPCESETLHRYLACVVVLQLGNQAQTMKARRTIGFAPITTDARLNFRRLESKPYSY